jgi:hypothetical protein
MINDLAQFEAIAAGAGHALALPNFAKVLHRNILK